MSRLDSLVNIKQRERESLRDYMNYFNVATLEVQYLDQSIIMSTLNGGLQICQFLFFLEKLYPKDFTGMLVQAEKYTNTEEAYKLYRNPPKRKDEKEKQRKEECDLAGGSTGEGNKMIKVSTLE